MSRILISNREAWRQSIDRNIKAAGISQSFACEENGVSVSAYRKIKIDNHNYFASGEDFACCCGTMFYDGLFEEKALEKLLADSADKTVRELRRRMYGSYMVVIKRGNVVKAFGDETNTYKVYYYHAGGEFIVVNSYFLIGACVGADPDAETLIENFVRAPLSVKTVLKGVRLLSAKEFISIDIAENAFEVKHCALNDYSAQYGSVEELADKLHTYLNDISSVKAKYLKRPMLFLTGGLDSRLELAADMEQGLRPVIAYWMGNDVITNGSARDLQISRELANKNGLPFRQYDVSESYEDALLALKARENKYGEYSAIYAGNSKWYGIFEGMENIDSVELGAFGEALRTFAPIDDSYHNGYSIRDVICDEIDYAGFGRSLFSLHERTEAFERDLLSYFPDVDPENLSIMDVFKICTCTRFAGDVSIFNFANLFVYSFQICAQKQVVDTIFSAPYEWLAGSKMPLILIEQMLRGGVLETPIYSHHRDFRYIPKERRIKKSLKFRAIDTLKPLLVDTKLYETLYLKFAHKYMRPLSVRNDEIFRRAFDILKFSPTLQKAGIVVTNPGDWRTLDCAGMAARAANVLALDLLAGSVGGAPQANM